MVLFFWRQYGDCCKRRAVNAVRSVSNISASSLNAVDNLSEAAVSVSQSVESSSQAVRVALPMVVGVANDMSLTVSRVATKMENSISVMQTTALLIALFSILKQFVVTNPYKRDSSVDVISWYQRSFNQFVCLALIPLFAVDRMATLGRMKLWFGLSTFVSTAAHGVSAMIPSLSTQFDKVRDFAQDLLPSKDSFVLEEFDVLSVMHLSDASGEKLVIADCKVGDHCFLDDTKYIYIYAGEIEEPKRWTFYKVANDKGLVLTFYRMLDAVKEHLPGAKYTLISIIIVAFVFAAVYFQEHIFDTAQKIKNIVSQKIGHGKALGQIPNVVFDSEVKFSEVGANHFRDDGKKYIVPQKRKIKSYIRKKFYYDENDDKIVEGTKDFDMRIWNRKRAEHKVKEIADSSRGVPISSERDFENRVADYIQKLEDKMNDELRLDDPEEDYEETSEPVGSAYEAVTFGGDEFVRSEESWAGLEEERKALSQFTMAPTGGKRDAFFLDIIRKLKCAPVVPVVVPTSVPVVPTPLVVPVVPTPSDPIMQSIVELRDSVKMLADKASKDYVRDAKQNFKKAKCVGQISNKVICPYSNFINKDAYPDRTQCVPCREFDIAATGECSNPKCKQDCGLFHRHTKICGGQNGKPCPFGYRVPNFFTQCRACKQAVQALSGEPSQEKCQNGPSCNRKCGLYHPLEHPKILKRDDEKKRDGAIPNSFQIDSTPFKSMGVVTAFKGDVAQNFVNWAAVKGRVFFCLHFLSEDTTSLVFTFKGDQVKLMWDETTKEKYKYEKNEFDLGSIDFNHMKNKHFPTLSSMGASRAISARNIHLYIVKEDLSEKFVSGQVGEVTRVANTDPTDRLSTYYEHSCTSLNGDCTGLIVDDETQKVVGFNIGMRQQGKNKFIPTQSLRNCSMDF